MQSQLNPYISFKDNARQAMEFYKTVFGGELTLSTFKEFGVSSDSAEDDKIMHAMLKADNGMAFMAADTPNSMKFTAPAGISISLSGTNEAELRGYYDKLAVAGTPTMPLEQAPWGDSFGMVVDRFGIAWMVNITPERPVEA